MPTTLNEWLEYINSLHTSLIDLGLQRIESIAKEQCLNTFSCPVIIIGGTNGKGSCVRFLESIYSAAGYRVGAYTSPHLYRFNERLRLLEKEVDDETLVSAFIEVESFRQNRSLSFFEFTTLAALFILKSQVLDVVLLEVGLGGRLDAVNVVEPDVSVVTSIGLDHMDWLGDTRESIAYEKAGIFRRNKPAICGDLEPPARLILHAKEIKSTLFLINKDFHFAVQENGWNWFSDQTHYLNLPIPHLKCQNAATSLMVIEALQNRLPVHEENIKQGIKNAKLSGRFEVFLKPVKGVLDVAHNPDSGRYLAEQLQKTGWSGKKIAVMGMLKDKDIPQTIEPLLDQIDIWFIAGLATERTANSTEIVRYLKTRGIESCYNFSTISEAFEQAILACHDPEDRLIVFGSFHTVAEVQKELKKERLSKWK